jgi:hypothetical protein
MTYDISFLMGVYENTQEVFGFKPVVLAVGRRASVHPTRLSSERKKIENLL